MPAPIIWQAETFLSKVANASEGFTIDATPGGGFLIVGDRGGSEGITRWERGGAGGLSFLFDMGGAVRQIAYDQTRLGEFVMVWSEEMSDGTIDLFVSRDGETATALVTAAGDQVDPQIVLTDDGGFALIYRDAAATGGRVRLNLYDRDNVMLSSTSLTDSAGGYQDVSGQGRHVAISGTVIGGAFDVVWIDGGDPSGVRHDTEGPGFGVPPRLLSDPAEPSRYLAHIDLEAGNVTAWISNVGSEFRLMADMLFSQPPVQIMTGLDFDQNQQIEVLQLQDERLMFLARSAAGDIVGQMVRLDGQLDGDRFTVNADGVASRGRVVATEMSDGRVAVAWETSAAGDDDLMFAILDPREEGVDVAGTDAREQLIGSRFDDVILGAGGDDFLNGENGADLLSGGVGDDNLKGGDGDDTLRGGVGGDFLSGGLGADRHDGAAGNDIVFYGATADGLIVNLATGVMTGEAQGDTFVSIETIAGSTFSDTITLGAGIRTAIGGGGDDALTGTSGDDILSGDIGDDLLIGGLGADTMRGDSTSFFSSPDPADVVSYAASNAAVTVNLATNVNAGGHAQGDRLFGIEILIGSAFNDSLTGNGLANTLDGGAGVDVLAGGAGDDVYIVDRIAEQIIELAGGGVDTVRTSSHFTLPDQLENGVVTAVGVRQLTGNVLDNILTGNAGNDTLDGKAGVDTLIGGLGDDTYIVDRIGDQVIELAGGGVDTVLASSHYTLAANVENAVATSTGNRKLTGNVLNNTLTGNAGDDILDGGSGADTLIGGKGNDTYLVERTADVIVELVGEGIDLAKATSNYTLGANVENGEIIVTSGRRLTGNDLVNFLTGNAGADTLEGGGGGDRLTGGAGADRFVYRNVSDSAFATFDRILDMEAIDIIDLSAIDARTNVAGDQAFSIVAAFTGVSGQMTIGFNAASNFTLLSMDVNGDGVADMRLVLNGDLTGFTNFVL